MSLRVNPFRCLPMRPTDWELVPSPTNGRSPPRCHSPHCKKRSNPTPPTAAALQKGRRQALHNYLAARELGIISSCRIACVLTISGICRLVESRAVSPSRNLRSGVAIRETWCDPGDADVAGYAMLKTARTTIRLAPTTRMRSTKVKWMVRSRGR